MGGIVVLSDDDGQNHIVIDAFSNKVYKCDGQPFDNIQYFCGFSDFELCECGISISSRILLRVMGKADFGVFLRRREEFWDDFRYKLFSHPNFCIQELNQYLNKFGEGPINEPDYHLKRFRFR